MTVTLKVRDQHDMFKGMIKNRIKYGNFQLKSGRYSDMYFDIKSLFCNGSFGLYAASCIELEGVDFVGGMESGAVPFVTAVSISYKVMPAFLVRKQTKLHGLGGRVISYVDKMEGKCCILDDVVTTGSSVDETVEVLKAEGHKLEVDSVVCIVDRTQGEYTKYPILSFFKEDEF